MTERKTDGPAAAGPSSGASPPGEDRVVVRDKRRINPTGDKPKTTPKAEEPTKPAESTMPAESTQPAESTKPAESTESAEATKPAEPKAQPEPAPEAGPDKPAADESVQAVVVEGEVEPAETVEGEVVDAEVVEAEPESVVEEQSEPAATERPLGAELEALRDELDERTRDLQRVSAEYANYRKRVDRDRGLVAEQAVGSVLTALLPVLDDLDRARDHGDLVGPFGAVADQFSTALAKFGLTPFGEKGDPFDPTRHEAVAHQVSPDVTEPTCVDVMRRGYLLGDRLLRPAMVAVADPE